MSGGTGGLRPSLPVALTVREVRRENEAMVTLYCAVPEACDAAARGLDLAAFVPGRFFMLWLPRLGEKPYAVSYLDERRVGITAQARGPFSTALCALEPDARLGLRGPFGRGFWDLERYADSERVALIGGGCGMAVLGPLVRALPHAKVVQGARTADALLFTDEVPEQVIFTDDGSAGRQGFPTEWLEEQTAAGALDAVYTCGPEVMMAGVAWTCLRTGIACQASMERYMKCGIGVCGQCECDGRLVCQDGPTFSAEELARMPSFGHVRRDAAGRRIEVAEAARCPSAPRLD
jgi:dihydroorotate dehydrogenase electron transfer subunit